MLRKLMERSVVLVLAVLILAVPALAACGNGDTTAGRPTVTIGALLDITGPNNNAVVTTWEGVTDYFKWLDDNDPLPVNLKWATYDTRTDYSRTPVGYQWLKGQNCAMIWTFSAVEAELIRDNYGEDEIPTFLLTTAPLLKDNEWIFPLTYGYPVEGAVMAEWAAEWWDYDTMQRPAKLGFVGVNIQSSVQMTESLEEGLDRYPGEFDLTEVFAPYSTTTWASEYSKIKDSDLIFLNTIGSGTASFLVELRERGYDGPVFCSSLALMAFWTLIRDRVPLEYLDGALSIHAACLWSDESPAMDIAEQIEAEYRADDEDIRKSTNWVSGVLYSMLIADCVRRAADDVGAENVDGPAMRDALATLNMTIYDWGEPWEWHPVEQVYHRMFRIVEYSATDDDLLVSETWFYPPDWAPL